MTPGSDEVRPNRLREHRLRYELTEDEVAEKMIRLARTHGIGSVAINASTVSRHETGRQRPRRHYRRLYCLLYDATEAELGLRPPLPDETASDRSDATPAAALLDTTWDPHGTVNMAAVLGRRKAVDRRAFLLLTGVSLTAPAHQWLIQEPGPLDAPFAGDTVSPGLADRLPPMITELRRMEDVQGGGLVLSLAEHEFAWIAELLDKASYTDRTARKLHTALAELGQLAGWTAYDAGRQALAQQYWIAALHAAHTAGDRALGAHILGDMAAQADRRGQPEEAVTLVETALSGARGTATPTLLALLYSRKAYAHAVGGDATACLKAVTLACSEVERMRPEEDPPWLYWMSRAEVTAHCGKSFLRLGQTEQAEPLLAEGVTLLDPSLVRDRQHFLTHLADCHLQPGPKRDLPAAADTANQALDLARQLSSARGTQRIRDLCSQMKPHKAQPEVREFLERAKTLLPAA